MTTQRLLLRTMADSCLAQGNLKRLGLGLLLVLTAVGCSRGQSLTCIPENNEAKSTATSTQEPTDPFANVQVNVGVDGSGSMFGYVGKPGGRYSSTIDALSTLFGSKGLKVNYWRLGANDQTKAPQPITANQFLLARTPGFYCNGQNAPFECVSSTLGQMYELPTTPQPPGTAEAENLSILITDLEPDSGAVTSLTTKLSAILRDKENYKVLLLGLRSEYHGPVYPAQENAFKEFYFSTDGKSIDEQGRPFYLLISGPTPAVDGLVSALRQLPMDASKAFRAVEFSGQAAKPLLIDRAASLQAQPSSCLSEVASLSGSAPKNREEWLLVRADSRCQDNPLPVTLVSQESVQFVGANLLPEAIVIDGASNTLRAPQVNVQKVSAERGRLQLDLAVRQDGSKRGGPVTLEVDRRSLNEALWKDWNSTVTNPAGPRTQNLMLFIGGMETAIQQQDQPAAKFCFGFQPAPGASQQSLTFPNLFAGLIASSQQLSDRLFQGGLRVGWP